MIFRYTPVQKPQLPDNCGFCSHCIYLAHWEVLFAVPAAVKMQVKIIFPFPGYSTVQ